MIVRDYAAHNEMVNELWASVREGNPIRVPMLLAINPRFLLLDPKLNTEKISFKTYFNDPDVMMQVQLRFQDYLRHHVYRDVIMGDPTEEEGWSVYVDSQNAYHAAWLGCELVYREDNCPSTHPILNDDNKNMLFDKGIPDPFSGYMGQVKAFQDHMKEKVASGMTYKGIPVRQVGLAGMGNDGPMTEACNLRGTTNFCLDIYEDPDYAEQLLDYVTDSIIARIRAWREYQGQPLRSKGVSFADDSIALLSKRTYQELIAPRHRRIIEALTEDMSYRNSVHLCGDATRHFRYLKDELNVYAYDTGFPVEHGRLLKELGSEVSMNGGVTVDLLLNGTPEQVKQEARRILKEVKPVSKRFTLTEANNLAPRTPLANLDAMYEAALEFGKY